MINTNTRTRIIFIIILTLLVVSFVFASSQKAEYSIDEIYSLVLSNSYQTDRFSSSDNLWGKWVSADDFKQFVTVQDGERFAFNSVYRNTSSDCHPPLYYWFLHAACSIFADANLMVVGLSLNAIFFIGVCVFIFLISKRLIHSQFLVFLPLITYGLSSFAAETYTFIRMYMLLTLIAMLFLYGHILLYQKDFKKRYLFIIWISIFLGGMTQYYFLIMSFWGVLFFCMYKLKHRKYKQMFIYGGGALLSALLMILAFPYAITQATGTSTNNVGNEVVRNLFNIKLWINMTWELIYSTLAGLSYMNMKTSLVIILASGLLFVSLLLFNLLKKKQFHFSFETIWIGIVFILSFLSISFIGGEYVYLRYIYFIIPIIFLFFFSIIDSLKPHFYIQIGMFFVCVAFSIINFCVGLKVKTNPYLYINEAIETDNLKKYSDKCLIVVTDDIAPEIPTGNYTKIINFNNIYMDSKDHILSDDVIMDCLQTYKECILFLPTDTYWINGDVSNDILSDLTNDSNIQSSKIANGSLGEFFHLTMS